MTPPDSSCRFDELSAGLALRDLSRDESRELDDLCQQHGNVPDPDLVFIASSLEIKGVMSSGEIMPAALSERLYQWADQLQPSTPSNIVSPVVPSWKKWITHPATGWAAAAAALFFAVFIPRQSPVELTPTTSNPVESENRLRAEANDLIERNFAGLGQFGNAGGKVIWSDARQEGYMILSGVPVNDPKQAQYQLWIVDPARDADSPVDGGVFDIPSDGTPVVIPIAAKLAVQSPQAFVITLEQPGGVVKSKQETVVALAKG